MTARLQGKISKHAGIPNPAPCSFTKQGIITNVKAVTSRANKSTDAAAQAGGRYLCPEISVIKNSLEFPGNCFCIHAGEACFILFALFDIFFKILLISG